MDPWQITLADVTVGEEERRAVLDVLDSRWLSMGPRTAELERRAAELLGVEETVAVTNGTAALHLAAVALGIGPGDEVVCPTLTFVASAAAFRLAGACVVFADSTSQDDLDVDPAHVERLVTERTKAIVVVHYGGHAVDMAAITEIAERQGLLVVEDAAHAIGATLDGRALGAIGDAGCFSFFPNKNVTTGEGGLVAFRDPEATARARLLRSHAMTSLTWDRHRGHATGYDVLDLGFNYRIDELRAALGLAQLDRLATLNERRAHLVELYRRRLAGLDGMVVPSLGGRGRSSHHLFVVLADDLDARERIRVHLRTRRIQTSVHYPPIHRFGFYAQDGLRLPVAEEVAERVVTLPLHPAMSDDDVATVCGAVEEALATPPA